MQSRTQSKQSKHLPILMLSAGLSIGVGLGISLGVAFGNIPVGLSIGAGVGISLGGLLYNYFKSQTCSHANTANKHEHNSKI
ncbi:hypothetical protein [Aliikangiella maris]|uniref:Glycine zipper family protein n=2 Tax=Aliikangiella maris TaxID=3162458 RepID=A0ABV3MJA6_9GAMM